MSVDSRSRLIFVFVLGMLALRASAATPAPSSLGIFEADQDVGTLLHPGSARDHAAANSYTIGGSGENMWFGMTTFTSSGKRSPATFALHADIAFVGSGGNPHRKAVLMIRQTLDAHHLRRHRRPRCRPHLTPVPRRRRREHARSPVQRLRPQTVRLEKRGDYFYAFVSGKDGKLQPAGASTKLPSGAFYVGIGVCSHDKNVVETAVFSNVTLQLLPPSGNQAPLSSLETISIASTDRHVEYVAPAHFEAPNWSRDGVLLLFNQEGSIDRLVARRRPA